MTVMEDWCVSSYKNDLPPAEFVLYYFMNVKKELKKKDKTLNEIEKMYGGTI